MYKIWINDEDARLPNCPLSVLHRSLQFDILRARTGHLCIDQECIDQNDAADRDEHISHMDKICERSLYTAVILSRFLESRIETESLQYCLNFFESEHWDTNLQPRGHHIAEWYSALQFVLEDTYFTRAWTYQEQRCSGRRSYLIPILPDLELQGKAKGLFTQSIVVSDDVIRKLDKWLQWDFRSNICIHMATVYLLSASLRTRFAPYGAYPQSFDNESFFTVTHMYDLRAMLLDLEQRDCKYISVRVAILTNINGFPISLRMTELRGDPESSYSTYLHIGIDGHEPDVYHTKPGGLEKREDLKRIMDKTVEEVLFDKYPRRRLKDLADN
jgi:hypothetical protein